MRMQGTVTEMKTVHVDINPSDMVKALKQRWLQNTGAPGEYINSNGNWETWIDTHGSGITNEYRQATEEELAAWKAFDLIARLDYKVHK